MKTGQEVLQWVTAQSARWVNYTDVADALDLYPAVASSALRRLEAEDQLIVRKIEGAESSPWLEYRAP